MYKIKHMAERSVIGSASRRGRLRRAGARPDRRILLAGAAAEPDAAVGTDEQRGRLDHGDLLRRIYGCGAAPRHADRSRRRQARLSLRGRLHDRGPSPVRPRCRWLLVGDGDARAHRHRLGRHLHDRRQAARGPGRCQAHVARRDRTRGEHRHLRSAVLLVRRSARRSLRLALRIPRRGLERERCVVHRGDDGAAPKTACACIRRRTGAFRFPPGLPQSLGHGLRAGLLHPHARDERAARLGRGVSRVRGSEHGRRRDAALADVRRDGARLDRHGRERPRQRGGDPPGPAQADFALR